MTHFTVLNLRPFDQDGNSLFIGVYNDHNSVDLNSIIDKITNNQVNDYSQDFSLNKEYLEVKSHNHHVFALGFDDHKKLHSYMKEIAKIKNKDINLKLFQETADFLVFDNEVVYHADSSLSFAKGNDNSENNQTSKTEEHNEENKEGVFESFSTHQLTDIPLSILNGINSIIENNKKNEKPGVLNNISDFFNEVLNSLEQNSGQEEKEPKKDENKKDYRNKDNKNIFGDNDYVTVTNFLGNLPDENNDHIQDILSDLFKNDKNHNIQNKHKMNNPFILKESPTSNNQKNLKNNVNSENNVDNAINDYFKEIERINQEFALKQEKLELDRNKAIKRAKNNLSKNLD